MRRHSGHAFPTILAAFSVVVSYGRISNGYYPHFIADLAAAMRSVCDNPARPTVSPATRQYLDRKRVSNVYANVFLWLAQGGSPEAART